jgi:ribosomal protein S18 acetylase RimI-like enzyme
MTELCLTEVPWEKRNLDMPAYQLEGAIRNPFVIESILEKKRMQLEHFFVQIKVDSEKINEAVYCQDAGFSLIEMSICPYLDLNLVRAKVESDGVKSLYFIKSDNIQNFENYCIPVKHLDSVIKDKIIEISKETFTSDRFHMDPSCNKSVADRRMALWLELDLLTDNKNFCTYLIINKTLIGFNIWNKRNMILAGISQEFKGKGLGKNLYIQTILDCMNAGLEEVTSNIALNNVPILNLYSKLGFSFRKPKYVLHYWF